MARQNRVSLPCVYPLPWKLIVVLTNKLLTMKRESMETVNGIANSAAQKLAFVLHVLEVLSSNFCVDAIWQVCWKLQSVHLDECSETGLRYSVTIYFLLPLQSVYIQPSPLLLFPVWHDRPMVSNAFRIPNFRILKLSP